MSEKLIVFSLKEKDKPEIYSNLNEFIIKNSINLEVYKIEIKNEEEADYFILLEVYNKENWYLEINGKILNIGESIKIEKLSTIILDIYLIKSRSLNLNLILDSSIEEVDQNVMLYLNYSKLSTISKSNFTDTIKSIYCNECKSNSVLFCFNNKEKAGIYKCQYQQILNKIENNDIMSKNDGIYNEDFENILKNEIIHFENLKKIKEKQLDQLNEVELNLIESLKSYSNLQNEFTFEKSNDNEDNNVNDIIMLRDNKQIFNIIKDSILNSMKEILNAFFISLNIKEWSFISLILLSYFIGVFIRLIV